LEAADYGGEKLIRGGFEISINPGSEGVYEFTEDPASTQAILLVYGSLGLLEAG
jgi:hypothetical protein